MAFALMPMTHALWFQALTADATVTTGAAPPISSAVASRTPTAPSGPVGAASPPTSCEHGAGVIALRDDPGVAGGSPWQKTFSITNTGTADAVDLLLGLQISRGTEFVSRVDFGNGQSWITDGLPPATLFLVDKLAVGAVRHVALVITMSEEWWRAGADNDAQIDVSVVSARCADPAVYALRITLGPEGATATPTVEGSATGSASSTATTTPMTETATTIPRTTETAVARVSATAEASVTTTPN